MKSKLLFFTFLFAVISANAQIQNGLVREQNSGKKPIPDAQIIFTDAPPASSDQSGNFRLVFSGKKTGDLILLKEIAKKGYEIVNERELQVLKIGNDDKLGKDIILAKAGVLDAAKKGYYDISDKALWASFNKAKNALQQQLKNAQISQEAYLIKFDTLSHQFEQQQKSLDALADVFARVNFDDVSEDYKKAFAFFEVGKIDEALVLLEKANLLNRTKNRIQERKRIEKAANALAQQKSENEKGVREDIQGMQLQSQLYVLTFQIEKAERLYDQMIRLDSTDLEILMDAADFYQINHFYSKGLAINNITTRHPKAEAWRFAKANGHLGELYTFIGNLPSALEAFTKFFESCRLSVEQNPTSSYYKNVLAISYSKLGETQVSLGNLSQALTFYEQYNAIKKELSVAYPQNVDYKNGLALSYFKLGSTYSDLGNLPQALTFFEQFNALEKELSAAYPQNAEYKNLFALSYSKLGEANVSLGNLPKALSFYEQQNALEKELSTTYPQNVEYKNGLAISYSKLGEIHRPLGDLLRTSTFFEKSMELTRALYAAYPQNVNFKKGLAICYQQLGDTHSELGNLQQALTSFELGHELYKELYLTHSQNVDFKDGLAMSYIKLGNTHNALGDLLKALAFFELGMELSKELSAAYPQNVDFKKGLAIAFQNLGNTHSNLGNLPKALTFFEQYNNLIKELSTAYPQNVDFKEGLAISYQHLGIIQSTLGNLSQALTFFELYYSLGRELYIAYPQNVDFKNTLAISHLKLASVYLETNDKSKAKIQLQEAEKHFAELHQVSPQHAQVEEYLDVVRRGLANLEQFDRIEELERRIRNEMDPLKVYKFYSEICDILRNLVAIDARNKPVLANVLNIRARCGFFLKKFDAAETDVREGLALDSYNDFLIASLAPALLFQGKRDLAFQEYQKWKEHAFGAQNRTTYRETFLADLKAFEKAGIIPPERKADVAAVRKLLSEPKKK